MEPSSNTTRMSWLRRSRTNDPTEIHRAIERVLGHPVTSTEINQFEVDRNRRMRELIYRRERRERREMDRQISMSFYQQAQREQRELRELERKVRLFEFLNQREQIERREAERNRRLHELIDQELQAQLAVNSTSENFQELYDTTEEFGETTDTTFVHPLSEQLVVKKEHGRTLTYDLYCSVKPQQLETECSVCLDKYEQSSELFVFLGCNHVFHKKCVIEWFAKSGSKTCPMCRNEM